MIHPIAKDTVLFDIKYFHVVSGSNPEELCRFLITYANQNQVVAVIFLKNGPLEVYPGFTIQDDLARLRMEIAIQG